VAFYGLLLTPMVWERRHKQQHPQRLERRRLLSRSLFCARLLSLARCLHSHSLLSRAKNWVVSRKPRMHNPCKNHTALCGTSLWTRIIFLGFSDEAQLCGSLVLVRVCVCFWQKQLSVFCSESRDLMCVFFFGKNNFLFLLLLISGSDAACV